MFDKDSLTHSPKSKTQKQHVRGKSSDDSFGHDITNVPLDKQSKKTANSDELIAALGETG